MAWTKKKKVIIIINIYIKQQNPKIHETNTDRIRGRNRQFYNNSWRLQYMTFNNRTSRQTITKEIEDLNNSTNQLDMNIFGTLYPTTGEYKFFSSAH